MHPGWKVFFQAFGAGFFTMLTMAHVMVRTLNNLPLIWPTIVICGSIALILFWFGGSGAEKLVRPARGLTLTKVRLCGTCSGTGRLPLLKEIEK